MDDSAEYLIRDVETGAVHGPLPEASAHAIRDRILERGHRACVVRVEPLGVIDWPASTDTLVRA